MTEQENFFEESLRIERIFYIPGTVADFEATPDDFGEEFVEDMPESPDAMLYQQLPALKRFAGKYPQPEDVAEALLHTNGFLVQAATPVRDYGGGGDSYSTYSWGRYSTEWLYAASEADIADVALEWCATMAAKWKAKAAA